MQQEGSENFPGNYDDSSIIITVCPFLGIGSKNALLQSYFSSFFGQLDSCFRCPTSAFPASPNVEMAEFQRNSFSYYQIYH